MLMNAIMGSLHPYANIVFMDPGNNYAFDSTPTSSKATNAFKSLRLEKLQLFYPALRAQSELKVICFPIFIQPRSQSSTVGHWVGVIAVPQQRRLLYLDSFHACHPEFAMPAGLQEQLSRFLDSILTSDPEAVVAPYGLDIVAGDIGTNPLQTNGYDCAIFMLTNLLNFSMHHACGADLMRYSQADAPHLRNHFVRTLLTARPPPHLMASLSLPTNQIQNRDIESLSRCIGDEHLLPSLQTEPMANSNPLPTCQGKHIEVLTGGL
jgi:hypothetical protein